MQASEYILLKGGRKLTEDETLVAGDVLVHCASGRICEPSSQPRGSVRTIDCQGLFVSPGFIDLQLNGCRGVDYSNPGLTAGDVRKSALWLPQTGVTSFLPTVVSGSPDLYQRVGPQLLAARRESRVPEARILGTHLEGPFFATAKRGAHRKHVITDPADVSVDRMYGPCLDAAALVTLAPEIRGGTEAVRQLKSRGIAVALGHTAATLDQARDGVDAGASLITHLYNGMTSFHHREPGVIGLLGDVGGGRDRPLYSIICDGNHVAPAACGMAQRSHPRGAVLVTDAMSVLGLKEGDTAACGHGTPVLLRGGRVQLATTGDLAGGSATMDSCVRNWLKWTACTPAEALAAASTRPARALGNSQLGTLRPGAHADVVVLDADLHVRMTFVGGALAWVNPAAKL
eukprot:TRINITY_DN17417_c0_g1_i1.p1 TRINITY_DN17417_c0_g1~~TRINITY_DN17417_c0_g1_i1.p1  ORF type:complete len:420 (+),score=92.40 TRINITY_DN17417_c0_g1_i1:56-1261(+)